MFKIWFQIRNNQWLWKLPCKKLQVKLINRKFMVFVNQLFNFWCWIKYCGRLIVFSNRVRGKRHNKSFKGSFITDLKSDFENAGKSKRRMVLQKIIFIFLINLVYKAHINVFGVADDEPEIQKCGSNMVHDYLYFLTKIGL